MATSVNKSYKKGYDDAIASNPFNAPKSNEEAHYYLKGYDDGVTDREVALANQRERERSKEYEQSKEGLCCGTIERIPATKEG